MNFEKHLNKFLEQLQKAEKTQNIDDWDKAIELGEQLKQKTPKRKDKRQVEEFLAVAHNDRGNAYLKLEEYQKAIQDYNKAIRLEPKFAFPYNGRGNAYVNLKKYRLAIEDFDKAIHLEPKLAIPYNGRGLTYNNLKNYQKAIKDLDTAIRLDPNNPVAYNNRGNSYNNLKNYQKAVKDFDTAIRLDPNDALPHNGRGNVYLQLKDHLQAIQDYNTAIRLDPNHPKAYYNRGNAYKKLEEYQKSINDYNTAIHLDPDYATPYNNRGNAYAYLKDYLQAIQDYNKAISLDPNDALVYNNRGNAYSDLKNYKKAVNDYSNAIRLDPNDARTYNNRGAAYSELKDYQKAINDYSNSIQLDPNFPIAYYNRGNAYLAKKKHLEAINNFKKIVSLAKETIDEDSTQKNEAKEFVLTRKELYLTAQLKDFRGNNDSLFTGKLDDTTLELLLQLWQVVKDIKKGHEITDEKTLKLAHYTSLETMYKLLPGIKDKGSCFRLNDARGMNDPNEGKRLLREVEGLEKFYNETTQETNSRTFITSFAGEENKNNEEDENTLNMWRLYGKDTRGAKLAFPAQGSLTNYQINTVQSKSLSMDDSSNIEKGHTNIPPSPLPMAVYKMKYETLEEENKNKVSEILQLLGSSNHAIREYVCYIMDEIRFLYKSKAFEIEKECRIVWVTSKTDPRVKLNEGNNNLYMEVENNDFLFKDKECAIWIGTGVEKKELVRDALKARLEHTPYKTCEVKVSDIEYIPSSK